MNWLILTIVSILLAGIGASIHRYILRDEHVISYGFLFTFLSGLCFIPVLFTEPIVLPQTNGAWFLIIATAILWFTVNVIGFTAVKKIESTLGKPLAVSKVLVVVVLSVLMLGEAINEWKLGGTLLLMVGVLVLTWQKGWLGHLRDEGVQLMLVSAAITGVIAVLDKFNMGNISPNLYGFMMYMFAAVLLGGMTSYRIPQLKKTIKNKWKAILFVTASYGAMYYFLLNAYKLADVNVVYPIYHLNMLLTVGLGYFWLGEKTQFKQRLAGAGLMIIGAILIALGA